MVEVPASTPVTMPVEEPILATEVLLLVQIPPLTASVNVMVAVSQTLVAPLMLPALGAGLTVII
jgi:hypothetical protein